MRLPPPALRPAAFVFAHHLAFRRRAESACSPYRLNATTFPADLRSHVRTAHVAIISTGRGKTTLTEKLLSSGSDPDGRHRKGAQELRHATSDWMEIESSAVFGTSSVMQFAYAGHTINLLDTPGHEDFSEDTYRC